MVRHSDSLSAMASPFGAAAEGVAQLFRAIFCCKTLPRSNIFSLMNKSVLRTTCLTSFRHLSLMSLYMNTTLNGLPFHLMCEQSNACWHTSTLLEEKQPLGNLFWFPGVYAEVDEQIQECSDIPLKDNTNCPDSEFAMPKSIRDILPRREVITFLRT